MKKFQASSFKFQGQRGFTLIELIVVLALFVFILDVTVTIFVSVVHHQKMILNQQEALNQANYMLENISQGIRRAKTDTIGNCLSRAGNAYELTHRSVEGFYQGIRFIDSEDICQEFFLDSDGVFKKSENSARAQPIISEKFNIKYAKFLLAGPLPRITMVFNIQTKADGQVQDQVLQTTVTQRNYK